MFGLFGFFVVSGAGVSGSLGVKRQSTMSARVISKTAHLQLAAVCS